jgi:hypothetical protein
MVSAGCWDNEKYDCTKILSIILVRFGAFWRHCYKDSKNKIITGAVPKDVQPYLQFLHAYVKEDLELRTVIFNHCFQGWEFIQKGFDK